MSVPWSFGAVKTFGITFLSHEWLKSRGVAGAVLVLSLAVTVFTWSRDRALLASNTKIELQAGLSQLNSLLEPILGSRFEAIHAAANVTLAYDASSRDAWQSFLQTVDWRSRFPGMLEVGYVGLGPETGSHPSLKVAYLDTVLMPAWHAPGFDFASDPDLFVAAQKCMALGDAASARSAPEIQAGSGHTTPLTVSFMPVRNSRSPDGGALNPSNISGLVFFALNQAAYFHARESELAALPLDIQLLPADAGGSYDQSSQRIITLNTVSGAWRFLVTTRPPPLIERLGPWTILVVGCVVSLLLSFLFLSQAQLRHLAEQSQGQLVARDREILQLNRDLEQRINERTAELAEANSRLARFAAVANHTSDLVAMAALDGSVLFLNQAGRRLMGFDAGTDLGRLRVADFYPAWVNELFQREAFPIAFRDGSWSGDVALLHRDGHEIPVSIVGLVLRSPDGQPEYMACIIRDISERRRLEESLRAALAEEQELNKLKGNFISMVSHEIRTPLALILGSSEILSRYLDRLTPEKRRRQLETIDNSVNRMVNLMEDVLLFSRAEAGRMEFKPVAMDLRKFCEQMADEITSATSQRCPIERSLSCMTESARADESLMRHIFSNLLTNAIKYSEAGCPVGFRLERTGGEAVFTVHDRGLGIPEEDRKRLFTPFYRGRNVTTIQGTGLGLVIVQYCVKRHGGHLEIESREGAGTTVTVRLPVFSPAHTEFIRQFAPSETPAAS